MHKGGNPGAASRTTDKYFVVKILNLPEDKKRQPQRPNGSAYDFSKEYMVLGTSELKTKQDGYDSEYKTKTMPEWEDEEGISTLKNRSRRSRRSRSLGPSTPRRLPTSISKKLLDDLAKKEADKPAATDPAGKTGPK